MHPITILYHKIYQETLLGPLHNLTIITAITFHHQQTPTSSFREILIRSLNY